MLRKRCLGSGPSELARVCQHHWLIHVKVKRRNHVVKGLNVLIECCHLEHVGPIPKIGNQVKVCCVVANGSGNPCSRL